MGLTGYRPDFLLASSQAVKVIEHSFDKAGITIAHPIRTLDLGNSSMNTLRR